MDQILIFSVACTQVLNIKAILRLVFQQLIQIEYFNSLYPVFCKKVIFMHSLC